MFANCLASCGSELKRIVSFLYSVHDNVMASILILLSVVPSNRTPAYHAMIR